MHFRAHLALSLVVLYFTSTAASPQMYVNATGTINVSGTANLSLFIPPTTAASIGTSVASAFLSALGQSATSQRLDQLQTSLNEALVHLRIIREQLNSIQSLLQVVNEKLDEVASEVRSVPFHHAAVELISEIQQIQDLERGNSLTRAEALQHWTSIDLKVKNLIQSRQYDYFPLVAVALVAERDMASRAHLDQRTRRSAEARLIEFLREAVAPATASADAGGPLQRTDSFPERVRKMQVELGRTIYLTRAIPPPIFSGTSNNATYCLSGAVLPSGRIVTESAPSTYYSWSAKPEDGYWVVDLMALDNTSRCFVTRFHDERGNPLTWLIGSYWKISGIIQERTDKSGFEVGPGAAVFYRALNVNDCAPQWYATDRCVPGVLAEQQPTLSSFAGGGLEPSEGVIYAPLLKNVVARVNTYLSILAQSQRAGEDIRRLLAGEGGG